LFVVFYREAVGSAVVQEEEGEAVEDVRTVQLKNRSRSSSSSSGTHSRSRSADSEHGGRRSRSGSGSSGSRSRSRSSSARRSRSRSNERRSRSRSRSPSEEVQRLSAGDVVADSVEPQSPGKQLSAEYDEPRHNSSDEHDDNHQEPMDTTKEVCVLIYNVFLWLIVTVKSISVGLLASWVLADASVVVESS